MGCVGAMKVPTHFLLKKKYFENKGIQV